MTTNPDIAEFATLISDASRASMLMHLLDGRSWTATELGKVAAVSPSTASVHLKKLARAELIRVTPAGRHRYFRLASAEVAQLLEQFALFASTSTATTPGATRASSSLRNCRLCYNHMAGRLGTAITESMVSKGWLLEDDPWFRLTELGREELDRLRIPAIDGRTCMDWSERRLHVAGPLGNQLMLCWQERHWVRPDRTSRSLWITPEGRDAFASIFGVSV
jgi:DNA-binding transcriptional ArsR family regulator